MLPQIIILFAFLIILTSCGEQFRQTSASTNHSNSSAYTGPIIDMNIHAFHEGNPMLGITHPPTLRNETFQGARSAEELKNLTLFKFQGHNIVKALVTDARGWAEEASDILLII